MRLLQGKKFGAILLIALILALSGCSIQPDKETRLFTYEPGISIPVISPYQKTDPDRWTHEGDPSREWALYYRVKGENVLVRVMEPVDTRDKTLEEALIEKLIQGPEPGRTGLAGVFAEGTSIIRNDSEGDTLLLTLSYHFLEAPFGMREEEVYLNRRLALASITSTITEETRYTSVQLSVTNDENDKIGRRISRSEIFQGEPDELLSLSRRSEEYLLTHHNAADMILRSIQSRSFDKLYKFVSGTPAESTFLLEMFGSRNMLTAYSLSSGMVSDDGQNAILIADLFFENAVGEWRAEQYAFRIEQENSLWKIKYETLKRMLEAT